MRVLFSEEAERGLEEVADYIAKDNPRRAVSFVRELRDAALALGDHPKAYPLIPRYEEYGHRRKPYRAYIIIYTVMADSVLVDAILHGSQDYEIMLFGDS
ncbi:type II toxin-antitoxin system RelE/ParE family toxin [Asticcacaulis tiandongensis]|uniref:type II toxin-antitoxin system RelE/ParE family toxin n=1 Tax=Asticcacaulis tiandongensis TaxID=2565365 RepID=UPI00112A14A6|nr:type II toxin-antitoxin system RelE/ParE family toxin [Asticcacaulis tiandongensis]